MITPIYLDNDIAAFAKPPGIATIPERSPLSDSFLKNAEAALSQKLFVVHRLDKEVSGIILFARNAAAHKHLNAQFADREVTKRYLLLTLGCIEPDQGSIEMPIRQFGSGRMGIDPVNGKAARTDYEVVRRYAGSTLVQAFPHTGRRHQLRVHFYSIGHPIAGDSRYGDKRVQSVWARLMLHAESIEFLAPSGQRLSLTAPPPPSFADVLEMLDQQCIVSSLSAEKIRGC
jgi:tRNA pseudouridine32 synthase / 23S rRNA pseudouridine746 synthase